MEFDVYLENEIDNLECEWDDEIILPDTILKELKINEEDLENNWQKGTLSEPWKAKLVKQTIIYPKGALVIFDGYEMYYVQRKEE